MKDFNEIKKDPEVYILACKNKNVDIDIKELIDLGNKRNELLQEVENLRSESNKNAQEIQVYVSEQNQRPPQDLVNKGKNIKEKLKDKQNQFDTFDKEFMKLIKQVPNLPSSDTPIGKDEEANEVLRKWGDIPDFDKKGFKPKEHWELGEMTSTIDLKRAVKVSGARFAYLKGDLVKLQFALIDYAFDKLTSEEFLKSVIESAHETGGPKLKNVSSKPFVEVIPPVLINPVPFDRMARLEPQEERYFIEKDNQYLIGSAEHTLGAMHMDEIIDKSDLPIRYVGYSTAFRREAGSYGKDTKGILRVHQFDKVEMESFTTKENSYQEQNFMVAIQEKLMQLLEIPYQVVICSTGDQGGPDSRHIDIEAWLPGQGKYRETHSADLMTDYQSRRLNTRYEIDKGRKKGEKELVHMNDATVFAIGRTIIAIMENYQQKDHSIIVPEVLRPLIGKDVICKI